MPEVKVCSNCTPSRKEENLKPIEMIELPARTEAKKLAIWVCPICDGDIAKIALSNN